MREISKNRVYQSKLLIIDDHDKKIRKDTLIYKDLLPFENLYKGGYFGGRMLLAVMQMKNVKN